MIPRTTQDVFEDLLAKTIGHRVSGWQVARRIERNGDLLIIAFTNCQDDEFEVTIRSAHDFGLTIRPLAYARIQPYYLPLTILRNFESIGSLMIVLREWT